jgi:hypothetical protein
MEILQITRKGNMMNTLERFHIYIYIYIYNETIKSVINAW